MADLPFIPDSSLPLVAAQPGIWIADQLSASPNVYAVAHYIDLCGPLEEAPLCQAIMQGMAEADTLRMNFAEVDGEARQWLGATQQLPRPVCRDLRQHPDAASVALGLMQQDLEGDLRILGGNPLLHNALLRIGDQRWFWYQRYHHIQVDGFSFTAITRRIAEIYRALLGDGPMPASPFIPFSDVVSEYQAYRQSSSWEKDARYWQDVSSALPEPASISSLPLTALPTSSRVIRRQLAFDQGDFRRLCAAQRSAQVGETDLAIALVAVWLTRLCRRQALTAGFIFMRRIGSAALQATGPVINVLPLPIQPAAGQSLAEVAAGLASTLKKMRRHQRYDAEQILRDRSRAAEDNALYGPVINLKAFDFRLDFNGIDSVTHHLATGPVRDMELALYLGDQGEFRLELLANAERYDEQDLAFHLKRLPLLLNAFALQPALAWDQASLLLPEETALLARVNRTQREVAPDTLASCLARQAAATPQATALLDQQHCLNYQQMHQQVIALALQLQQRGVRPGDIVAVALPRSIFLSLALQAIVTAGAAYLPLDTGYPDDRLALMLDDARPQLLIADRLQAARLSAASAGQVLIYQHLLTPVPLTLPTAAVPTPQQTAYIIYTSGSTGRPKGVMVSHQAIVNRLQWMQHQYPLGADDVVLQKTPCSFDVSVWEFFWPLMTGARLVMAPPDAHRDPEQLQQLFAHYQVTTTHFVPSMLAAFVHALDDRDAIARLATLRRVFCSGEALPTELCRQWEQLTGVQLHNLYGPTEAAVDVSWYPAYGEALRQIKGSHVPIGYPVWNTGMRILDNRLQPVPVGMPGDLYLTGVQLAQGYLDRPSLTAGRFVADPYAQGERMYRSGDVARWLPDGAIEYLGRSDFQLKIRGQRIELTEIDAVLQNLPGVAQAVTHAMVLAAGEAAHGDNRQLVGYFVPQSGLKPDPSALRARLAEQLPAHMVPVALIELAALPLSANGKLDRNALPAPAAAGNRRRRQPASGLEQQIALAFAEVLASGPVSADDDFFALGGHSLLAMRLAATLRRQLQVPLTVGQIMVASTVASLAKTLAGRSADDGLRRDGFEPLLPLRRTDGPTLFCFHPASGFAWQFSILLRYLDPRWALMGIQSPTPQGPLAQGHTLTDVCDAHLATVRSVQPHGPYYFIGYSLGGTLAQGVAARLQAMGEQVEFLGLLDTWPPESQNWDEKRGENVLDQAVLDEMQRERQQFIAAQQGMLSPEEDSSFPLFDYIEANYASSVRLLTTARSSEFSGEATLFVAQHTLPAGMDVTATWGRWIKQLRTYPVNCDHVDIISPATFRQLGPLINQLLSRF